MTVAGEERTPATPRTGRPDDPDGGRADYGRPVASHSVSVPGARATEGGTAAPGAAVPRPRTEPVLAATSVPGVTMRAGWFGSPRRPLYGVWHLPADGTARGAVVLAPGIGLELDLGHRALRVLADRLAQSGAAVLRFDYDGTGDSAGDDRDPDRVPAWLGSVRDAVDAARAAGAPHVTLVGLRIGATLAASARAGADALVLWDPCATGKAYLRQESVMFALNVSTSRPEPRTDGSVDGPGSVYTAETVAALGELALRGDDVEDCASCLVLLRDDKPDNRTTKAVSGRRGVQVEEVSGQAAMLEVSGFLSKVPLGTVERIVDWVAERLPDEPVPIAPSIEPEAVVATLPDGTQVVESVQSLGPHRLFGILTEPRPAPAAPLTVVFSNSATTYHVGSARSWVELSRRIAAHGVRGLRIDQRDLGDGPDVAEPPGPVYYNEESLEDLRVAAESARSASSGDVALVGLCSGSWSSAVVAEQVKPAGLLLLNPWVWDREVSPMGPVAYPAREMFTARVSRALSDRARLRAFGARVLSWLWALRPDFLWRAAASLHLGDTTGATVGRIVDGGTDVLVVMGPREAQIFRRGLGYGMARRLERSGRLALLDRPALDHGMLHSRERDVVLDRVVADVAALAQRVRDTAGRPT